MGHPYMITYGPYMILEFIWTIYDHLWNIYDHAWSIYDHIWTIYDHIWSICDHIWTISAYPFRGLIGVCGLFSLLWFPHNPPKMRSFGCGHFDATLTKRVQKLIPKRTCARTHLWDDFGPFLWSCITCSGTHLGASVLKCFLYPFLFLFQYTFDLKS